MVNQARYLKLQLQYRFAAPALPTRQGHVSADGTRLLSMQAFCGLEFARPAHADRRAMARPHETWDVLPANVLSPVSSHVGLGRSRWAGLDYVD